MQWSIEEECCLGPPPPPSTTTLGGYKQMIDVSELMCLKAMRKKSHYPKSTDQHKDARTEIFLSEDL